MSGGRAAVLAAFVSFGAFWGAWGAALPEVRQQARVDDGGLGLAVLMVGFGALCSMRAMGLAVDRFGDRAVMCGLIAMAAAGFLPAMAHCAASLTGALLLTGAASGAMDVSINALAVHEEARTGSIMNAAHACFSGAAFLSASGAGALLGLGASVPAVFAVIAILGVVIAFLVRLLARRTPLPTGRPAAESAAKASWSRSLMVLGGLCALAYLVENAWQSWSAVLVRTVLGRGPVLAAVGPAMFAAAAAAGRLFGHRFLAGRPPRGILVGGATVAAAGTVLAALAPVAALNFVGVVIAGLGTSVCAPTILSAAGSGAGRQARASAISVVTTLGYSGFVVGPAAVGAVASVAGLRWALLGVGGVAAALAVWARSAPELPGIAPPLGPESRSAPPSSAADGDAERFASISPPDR
ncbi:MFS transporter [Catenulispora pinisilvae]|uniref:MFS transporter n=1 Tax=Catenulispora pinisilvae TaxID=2705253 RepID=UPI001891CF76|nr:MFS transporter [Catenulispora pinisilvae]